MNSNEIVEFKNLKMTFRRPITSVLVKVFQRFPHMFQQLITCQLSSVNSCSYYPSWQSIFHNHFYYLFAAYDSVELRNVCFYEVLKGITIIILWNRFFLPKMFCQYPINKINHFRVPLQLIKINEALKSFICYKNH